MNARRFDTYSIVFAQLQSIGRVTLRAKDQTQRKNASNRSARHSAFNGQRWPMFNGRHRRDHCEVCFGHPNPAGSKRSSISNGNFREYHRRRFVFGSSPDLHCLRRAATPLAGRRHHCGFAAHLRSLPDYSCRLQLQAFSSLFFPFRPNRRSR